MVFQVGLESQEWGWELDYELKKKRKKDYD